MGGSIEFNNLRKRRGDERDFNLNQIDLIGNYFDCANMLSLGFGVK